MTVVRATACLALAGATAGTLLDVIHVRTGTTAYAAPAFAGLAWWVPALFAAAGVAIGLSHAGLERALDVRRAAPTPPALLAGLAILGLAWVASGALPCAYATTGLVLAAVAVGVWWTLDRTALGVVLAVATAAVGTGVEAALAHAGVFHYLRPDMGPVASWLPWLYVVASVTVGNLGRALWR